MKRFVFNLETLLRHRENLEEKERNELARLRYLRQTEVNNRERLRRCLGENLRELCRLRSLDANSEEILWFYPYLDRLRYEIGLSEKTIAQLDKEVEKQLGVVIEATKKKKVLDSLKSRRLKEYNLGVERQEQKNVDEIVVTRYARKDG